MRSVATVMKALADETRLRMTALLLDGDEICVCRFVEILGITQSKASRHLRILVAAGLLDDRRDAVWVHYRLADRPGKVQAAVLGLLPSLLAGRVPAAWLAAVRRLRRTGTPRPACAPPRTARAASR